MDAFDADVLIYAAVPGHALGTPVLLLLAEGLRDDGRLAGVGSTLLLPEVLTKPTRDGADDEVAALAALLGRLDLRPVDEEIALLAVALGASYGLRSADAVHLATAVAAGADRFITNNRKDFGNSIGEIAVTYPTDLS
ncbi:MAG TPA: PIN domain-containing protein [Acidimicrobiales bacterium]|nr:PIN domain-containing protein [Acidimicrobiales bacterium]